MNEKQFKVFSVIEKQKSENGKDIFYFVASTEDVDRDGDIVIVTGIDLTNYKKNPVVLFAHQHREKAIGKVVDMKVEDSKLIVGIEFADTQEANEIKYLVENGFMKAVSIGFIAKEVYSKEGYFSSKTFEDLKEEKPDIYNRVKNKLRNAINVITKCELFEISIVPVPANQNALAVMKSKGIKTIFDFNKKAYVDIEDIEVEEKNAVSTRVHPKNMKLDAESEWDKDKAIETLRKWASTDGSGDKDKMKWTDYKKGFAWYDANAIDNFTSYKYPHHIVKDGDFYVVWRGVASAMAYFMANMEYIPADDRKGVYDHLAYHYKQFDKTPPEYKENGDYTIKELYESGVDEDTIKYFITFNNKSFEEIKSILEEFNMIENVEKKIDTLTEIVKEISEKLVKVEKAISEIEKESKSTDVVEDKEKEGSPSAEKNAEVESEKINEPSNEQSSTTKAVEDEEEVFELDDEELKEIVSMTVKNILKIHVNGGK